MTVEDPIKIPPDVAVEKTPLDELKEEAKANKGQTYFEENDDVISREQVEKLFKKALR